jgi:tetratricopeptide (TPR) repeat protein
MKEASPDFTLPGIVEMMFGGGSSANITEPEVALRYANQARAIAPSSPIGTRLLVLFTPSPKAEDLTAWEKTAADDSTTLLGLAQKYAKLDEKEAAIRCWEKSIAALPSVTAVTELAAFHRKQGDLKKWEETLTAFLNTPTLGLEHSVVQQQLAFGFAHTGEWSKAKPYAIAAAQTYSCSSLETGSYIAEGLGEWDLSEQLIRAAATNYPTGKGAEWYIWCRRTGRGDVKAAEPLAEKYFALPQPHPDEVTFLVRGMWELLRGNVGPARDSFLQVLNLKRTFTYTCLVAQLSRELKDETTSTEVFDAMEKDIQNAKPDVKRPPDVIAAGRLMVDLVKNGNPTPERVSAIEQYLLKFDEEHRQSSIGWCYIIGAELERAGNKKEAEKYWRRALIDANRDQLLATLAGAKLAKYNHTSRPDDDALAPKDLWPPHKPKK